MMRLTAKGSDSNTEAFLKRNIAFISRELEDDQTLISKVHPQVEVVFLDCTQDGITQITNALRNRQLFQRIHLLTPGKPGCLHIGNSRLNPSNLPCHAGALYQWRSHLTDDAEILIYNSHVASNETGKLLIDALHYLTGAAIAASTIPISALSDDNGWEFDCVTRSLTPVLAFPSLTLVIDDDRTVLPYPKYTCQSNDRVHQIHQTPDSRIGAHSSQFWSCGSLFMQMVVPRTLGLLS